MGHFFDADIDLLALLVSLRLGSGRRGRPGLPGRIGPQGQVGPTGERGQNGERGERGEKGSQGRDGTNGAQGDKGDPGPKGDAGLKGDKGETGDSARSNLLPDFSVGAASVHYGYADGSVALRTGRSLNPIGAFSGSGRGNKAILGIHGYQIPFGALQSVTYTWRRIAGPGGPFYSPPSGPSVQTPYVNLIVDFGPPTGLRILVVLDDSLNGAITAAIGNYSNTANELTYSWQSTQAVLIVGQVAPAPGGVLPTVSVGPLWPENAYLASALLAANPNLKLVAAYTGDGGMPAGALLPSVLICSGDSGNTTEAGYQLTSIKINGTPLVP